MLYYLVKIISKVVCLLPLRFSLFLGKIAGWVVFLLDRRKKSAAISNLKLAFPEKNLGEIRKILRKSFENFGRNIIEVLRVPLLSRQYFDKYILIEGREFLEEVSRQNKGIILGVHMGSWEIVNICLPYFFKYAVFARRQKDFKGIEKFLNEMRISKGLGIIFEDEILKTLHLLKKNVCLGMVFDHGFKKSDIEAEFFGKKVLVPMGVFRLALRSGVKIFPAVLHRIKGPYHCLRFYPAVAVEDSREFVKYANNLNKLFEGAIKQSPADYLWWFKRFKRSLTSKVLVLSDGKPGHFKQSLSLAKMVKHIRPQAETQVVEIKLNRFQRLLLDLANIFSSSSLCQGCFRCLRLVLGKDFRRVFKYADIVISAGSSLSSLNRIYSYNIGAKSFCILKPNTGRGKYDLLVVPEHDRIKNSRNLVRIKGALAYSDKDRLQKQSEKLKSILSGYKENLSLLGIFIGGKVPQSRFDFDIGRFFEVLKNVNRKTGVQFVITTSPRTPEYLERSLEENAGDFPAVKKIIIFNRENFDFAVEGILGLSRAVVITADSVSMISESLSAGRAVIVLDTNSKIKKKHRKFVESLAGRDKVKLSGFYDLERNIEEVLSLPEPRISINPDIENVVEHIRKVL